MVPIHVHEVQASTAPQPLSIVVNTSSSFLCTSKHLGEEALFHGRTHKALETWRVIVEKTMAFWAPMWCNKCYILSALWLCSLNDGWIHCKHRDIIACYRSEQLGVLCWKGSSNGYSVSKLETVVINVFAY